MLEEFRVFLNDIKYLNSRWNSRGYEENEDTIDPKGWLDKYFGKNVLVN